MMPKKRTIRQRLIDGLLAHGAQRQVPTRGGGKTMVFLHPDYPGRNIYVGTLDSLRVGKTKAGSIPADRLKARILAEQSE